MTDIEEEFEEYSGPSKSQVKREMHALQALGQKICELPKKQLSKLPLSDIMMKAVEEWHRIKKNEAKRRHLQFVGRIMRSEDLEAVQEAMDMLNPSSEIYNRILHQQEKWRDRLINEGNEAVKDFADEFEVIDMQNLRALIRNAVKEQKEKEANPDAEKNTGKTAARKLFLAIKEHYKEV
ncbi:MAG: ribosome-associated protein [Psychrobacter glaciei]|jgi:ribosome-associated protein